MADPRQLAQNIVRMVPPPPPMIQSGGPMMPAPAARPAAPAPMPPLQAQQAVAAPMMGRAPQMPPQVMGAPAVAPMPQAAPQPVQQPQPQPAYTPLSAAQQMGPPQQPMMGGVAGFQPPEPSPLFTDARQAKAAQLWDQALQGVAGAQGASARDRKMQSAGQVFAGLVGLGMSAFGGGPGGVGAQALVNGMSKQVDQAKSEQRLRQGDAMNTLKDLTNIINNTSKQGQKNITDAAKLALSQEKNQQGWASIGIKAFNAQSNDKYKTARAAEIQDYHKQALDLKKQGLDIAAGRLQAYVNISNAQLALHNKLGELDAKIKVEGMTQQNVLKRAQLQQDASQFNAAKQMAADQFNQEMASKMALTQGGQKVYPGLTLPPVEVSEVDSPLFDPDDHAIESLKQQIGQQFAQPQQQVPMPQAAMPQSAAPQAASQQMHAWTQTPLGQAAFQKAQALMQNAKTPEERANIQQQYQLYLQRATGATPQ